MPTLDILGTRIHSEESNMKLQARNVTEEALVMKIQSMVQSNYEHRRFFSGLGFSTTQ
jgi:hypothetical protein